MESGRRGCQPEETSSISKAVLTKGKKKSVAHKENRSEKYLGLLRVVKRPSSGKKRTSPSKHGHTARPGYPKADLALMICRGKEKLNERKGGLSVKKPDGQAGKKKAAHPKGGDVRVLMKINMGLFIVGQKMRRRIPRSDDKAS